LPGRTEPVEILRTGIVAGTLTIYALPGKLAAASVTVTF
jgi:hypothetical protein